MDRAAQAGEHRTGFQGHLCRAHSLGQGQTMAMQAEQGRDVGVRASWKATGLLCTEGSSGEVAAKLIPAAAR